MIALTQFYPYVLPQVIGCPEPVVLQALRAACIEFCNSSLYVQELVQVSETSSVSDYEVDVPSGMELAKVIAVWLENNQLRPRSLEMISAGVALVGDVGSASAQTGTPTDYYQKTPTAVEISLYPVPATSVSNAITIRAAFKPSWTAEQVDDSLFTHWVEGISAGALARLQMTPGQDFTDAASAASNYAKFQAAVRSATILARQGRVVAASRVRPRRFA